MHYIILALVIFISVFLLYRNRQKIFDDKRIVAAISIVVIILISLRFGQVLLAAAAVLFPIILRMSGFLLRNIGIFNIMRYFSRVKPNSPTPKNKMSKKEAYAILGLKPGASNAEITAQYRKLMKQNHPDKGGSRHLSTLINQAKDKLAG